MPARGTELIEIPDRFWTLPQTIAALRARDIGELFLLVQQHTKASQTQIATACGRRLGVKGSPVQIRPSRPTLQVRGHFTAR
jgi:hypothetical protein